MSISGIGGFSTASLASRILSRGDTDSSGTVSLDEFKTAAGATSTDTSLASQLEEVFSAFDEDGDSALTSGEIATGLSGFADSARQLLLQLQEASGETGGSGPPPGAPRGAGGPPPKPSESFGTDDADGSGALSLEEFQAAGEARGLPSDDGRAEEIFSAMDVDGDGAVTLAEMESFEEERTADAPGRAPTAEASAGEGSSVDVSQLLQGLARYASLSSASGLASLFETAA